MKIRAIITGTTGMVGEGVLHECLLSPDVEAVLVINRRPCGVTHPKLKEIIHADFFDISPLRDQLSGYNACYFCLGVSSVGMNKETYYKMTYVLTMHIAETLSHLNRDMTFCYVSGAGTDSTEKGMSNWSRVKGKTENDLMKLPFKAVFAFRPGFIRAIKGMKYTHSFYKYVGWMFPMGRALFPGGFAKMEEIGQAMIHVTLKGFNKKVLEGKDIIALGQKS
jgi:hypothetical protein